MICKNCGTEIEANRKFCPNCGATINNDSGQEKILGEETSNVKSSIESSAPVIPVPNEENGVPVTELQREVAGSKAPKVFYKLLVLCAAASAVTQIVLVLTGSQTSFESYFLNLRLIVTTICVFGLSILNINYASLYDKGENKFLAIVGTCFSTIVCLAILAQVWGAITIDSVAITKCMAAMIAISLAIYHASFILVCDFKSYFVEKLAHITYALIAITYGFFIICLFASISGEFISKMFSISVILTLFMTIATLLLNNAE